VSLTNLPPIFFPGHAPSLQTPLDLGREQKRETGERERKVR
jgi:hypothetical protein